MGEACLRVEAAASRLEKGGQASEEGDKVGEVASRFRSCDFTFQGHSFVLFMLWGKGQTAGQLVRTITLIY